MARLLRVIVIILRLVGCVMFQYSTKVLLFAIMRRTEGLSSICVFGASGCHFGAIAIVSYPHTPLISASSTNGNGRYCFADVAHMHEKHASGGGSDLLCSTHRCRLSRMSKFNKDDVVQNCTNCCSCAQKHVLSTVMSPFIQIVKNSTVARNVSVCSGDGTCLYGSKTKAVKHRRTAVQLV